MDLIDCMKAFVLVAENESFVGAANVLHLSRSSISRKVGHLEERLGTRLLTRSTRRVSLTPDGIAYLQHCERVTSEIDEVEAAFRSGAEEPRGVLAVSSPTALGVRQVAPGLCTLQARYSDVVVELVLRDPPSDPAGEGLDLVIRDQPGPTSHLVTSNISVNRHVLAASPDFIHQYGMPVTPQELEGVRCVHYSGFPTGRTWTLYGQTGEKAAVRIKPVMVTTSGEVMRSIAIEGGAVVLLPTYLLGDDIRAGRLVRILPEYQGETYPIAAVCAPRRLATAKVRTAISVLREQFGGPNPTWDEGLSLRPEPTIWIDDFTAPS